MKPLVTPQFTKSNVVAVLVLYAATTLLALSTDARLARYMVLTYAVILACGGWILATVKGRPLDRILSPGLPAGCLIIWSGLVCFIHPATSILAALSILIYALGLAWICTGDLDRKVLYDAVCLFACLNVVWQILQWTGIPIVPRPSHNGYQSLIGLQANVDETQTLFAVCLPAFFRRNRLWLLPVPLAGIVMSQCIVGAVAASAIATLYGARFVHRRWGTRAVIGLVVLALTVTLAFSAAVRYHPSQWWSHHLWGRAVMWQDSAVAALQKPLSGWGFGQYGVVMPLLTASRLMPVPIRLQMYEEVEDKQAFVAAAAAMSQGDPTYFARRTWPGEVWLEAHNEFVEILFAAGIPGLILLLWSCAALLRKGWQSTDPIPCLGLLASCIGASVFFPWQIVPIAIITALWAGLILKEASS